MIVIARRSGIKSASPRSRLVNRTPAGRTVTPDFLKRAGAQQAVDLDHQSNTRNTVLAQDLGAVDRVFMS